MSMYLLPKTITEILYKQRRKFLWQGNSLKKKYQLVKWSKVCQSKKTGGLGIKDIKKMNISLLCKWWWKLQYEEGLWQSIIRAKYMRGGRLIGAVKHKIDDSPVWSDLLKVKYMYLSNRKIKVKNGLSTLFWEDPWINDKPLCLLHPVLYELCTDKLVSDHFFLSRNAQLNFSRWLSPILFNSWVDLVDTVYSYSFTNSKDAVTWKKSKIGSFSSRSVYDSLTSSDQGQPFLHIWKAKIPHRIKVFMWLLENDAVLTKDNLIRRNWLGSPTCYFCSDNENADHLFFHCPIARVLWGLIGICIGASNIPLGLV